MSKKTSRYSCRFKGCSYSTIMRVSFTRHENSHLKLSKRRNHTDIHCPSCEWFGKHGSLRKHIKIKHP